MTAHPPGTWSARGTRSTERHIALSVEAPAVPVERFLGLPLKGEPLVWDAGPEGAFAARGAALSIEASGEARFELVKVAAERLSANLVAVGESVSPRDLRFFGGFSFEPGVEPHAQDPAAEAAATLGEASFRLGEWTYQRFGERARLQRIVAEGRWRSRARELVLETESVTRALADATPIDGECTDVDATPPADAALGTFCTEVADAVQAIARDELLKVVLSRRVSVPLARPLEPARIVAALRALEPECTRFLVERDGVVFLGASPERLVTMRDGRVRVDALAGSAPLGEGNGAALLGSDKDLREHAVVVDALRECLADWVDDIAFEPTMLRVLRSVQHLWTKASARARPNVHVLDLVEALHPTPAVSGYPRTAARAWIRAREPHARGWYAAPVGWFDAEGSGSFAVAIRSALVRDRTAWLHAGAGIVAGSDPVRELDETTMKLRPMREALALATGAHR